MAQCAFNEPWRGQCKNQAHDDGEYCLEHAELYCCVCGEHATTKCMDSVIGFMCGAPLCGKYQCQEKHRYGQSH